MAKSNGHGTTSHGHPCCPSGTADEKKRARCGGRALCQTCAEDARRIHGE